MGVNWPWSVERVTRAKVRNQDSVEEDEIVENG